MKKNKYAKILQSIENDLLEICRDVRPVVAVMQTASRSPRGSIDLDSILVAANTMSDIYDRVQDLIDKLRSEELPQ